MDNEETFFIIDSNSLEDVGEIFCGYAICDGKLIMDNDITKELRLTGDGLYIYVSVTSNSIIVEQDFMGGIGLYVYEFAGNFVLSNSFAKLVDYLKGKYEFSFNKRFAESLISAGLCSLSHYETLVNEIMFLPRYYKLVIDKKDKTLNYEKIDYGENSIDLDSKEALEVLDKWYYKWISVIRFLRDKTNNFSFDISGGFDSRMSSTLWLSADINFDNLNFNSLNRKDGVFAEDFKIASQIADEFNFKLNNRSFEYDVFPDYRTALVNAINLKLGATNASSFKQVFYKDTIYKFSGFGGETVRGHPNPSKNKYMRNVYRRTNENDHAFFKSTESVLSSTLDKISESYGIPQDFENLISMHYKETRNRYHFGKLAIEFYFNNMVTLMPLLDVDLHKLKRTTENCGDKLLLAALIFLRYCPKLLDFRFQGGRKINENTLEFAKKINEKYPFTPLKNNVIDGPEFMGDNKSEEDLEHEFSVFETLINDRYLKLENFLDDVFTSDKFEEEFVKHFSSKSYYSIQKLKNENRTAFLQSVFASISCLRIVRDVEGDAEFSDDIGWLESFLDKKMESSMSKEVKGLLIPFATLRIDMKNYGNENNYLKIIDISDKHASITTQSFITNHGRGAMIESHKGKVDFYIKCINSGKLKIYLRGKGIMDKNKKRFPTYIDLKSFKIDDEEHIHNSKVISHDNYYFISSDVEDGDVLHIQADWTPFNRKSTYEAKLQKDLDEMEEKNKIINDELNKTKGVLYEKEKEFDEINQELEETQKELDEVLNSNSLNITKPLRKIINNFKK